MTGIRAALREQCGKDQGTSLPELQIALLNAALSDQSRRQLATASRIAIGSPVVAGAALAVAVITLLTS